MTFTLLSTPIIYYVAKKYYSNLLFQSEGKLKSKVPILNIFNSIFTPSQLECGNIKNKNIEVIDNEYYVSDISTFMNEYYISPNSNKKSLLFLCSENAKQLTQQIAKDLNCQIGRLKIIKSSLFDESKIEVLENVSQRNVVFVSNLGPNVNDNLMELLFTISSLKRSSAKKIIVVIPYLGYSNKVDKDSFSNYPLYSSLIIKLIESLGADQIISINLCSKHATGYSYSIPIIDLDMTGLGVSYYKEKLTDKEILSDPIVISPHVKSVPRAKKFQEMLNSNDFEAGFGFVAQSNKSSEEKIDFHVNRENNYIGDDFQGKDIIIVDDMIKSGETLGALSDILKKKGSGNIYSFIYHDLSEHKTKENIENSSLKEVVLLDTANSESNWSEKLIKLSTSKILSKYIGELI